MNTETNTPTRAQKRPKIELAQMNDPETKAKIREILDWSESVGYEIDHAFEFDRVLIKTDRDSIKRIFLYDNEFIMLERERDEEILKTVRVAKYSQVKISGSFLLFLSTK